MSMMTLPSDAAHAQEQDIAGPSPLSFDHHSSGNFVSRQDFEVLNNQLEEKFARFEALLSRTNIYSTPKMPVNVEQPPISDTPFINPSPDPRATGPVRPPGQDQEFSALKKQKGVGKSKPKKSSKPAAAAGSASQVAVDAVPASKTVVPGPGLQVLGKPVHCLFPLPVLLLQFQHLNQFLPVLNVQVLLVLLYRTPQIALTNQNLLCRMLMSIPSRTSQIGTLVRKVNSQIQKLLKQTKK